MPIAIGLPGLVPSCDFSSPFPLTNKRDVNVQQLITKLEISGQITLILSKNTLRLRLLTLSCITL